jgi:CheY-like chemotaxis protein
MPDTLLSGKRCLVLDDEFPIAFDIQQILELAGAAHVACATSATEAIETLRCHPKFDVELDVKLSGPVPNSFGVAALLAPALAVAFTTEFDVNCDPISQKNDEKFTRRGSETV